jgi:type I restriction enzyme S subunit
MNSWKRSVLGMLCNIRKGFTPSTGNSSYWGGDIDWLSIADMNQGKYISSTNKKITEAGAKNRNIIKKGTLLMSFKLTIGKLGILNKDMYTNEAICNFQWNTPNISTEFMYYYLSSINIKKYGSQAAKGITLNNDTLNAIPVFYPSFDEQEKIANFLSVVDKKIELMEKKYQFIKKYKMGLMQKIFSQEINFKGEDKELEVKKIGDYLIESKIVGEDKINKRLTVKLNLKGVYPRDTTTVEKIGATKQYIRKAGQFIYGKQNLFKGAFGIVPDYLDGYLSSSDIPSFDFKKNINPIWFYYYFSRESFYRKLEDLSTGTGSKRVSPNDFLKIKISILL